MGSDRPPRPTTRQRTPREPPNHVETRDPALRLGDFDQALDLGRSHAGHVLTLATFLQYPVPTEQMALGALDVVDDHCQFRWEVLHQFSIGVGLSGAVRSAATSRQHDDQQ